ncbi:MAG TPA: CDP-diacylglycerol--glycerol-3-phosphate 3-phosphatidyltransferase [bacterium]
MNLPTQLTVLRIILTPLFLFFIFYDGIIFKIIALIVYIIASITDHYDGYYARKLGAVSKLGRYLDPLADKILVSSALVAFNILGFIQLWIVIIIVFRDFLITGLRSYALFKNQQIVTTYIAKVKTTVQMVSVFIIFAILIFKHLAIESGIGLSAILFLERIHFVNILMFMVAALTVYTGIHYFVKNSTQVKSIFKDCYQAIRPSDS